MPRKQQTEYYVTVTSPVTQETRVFDRRASAESYQRQATYAGYRTEMGRYGSRDFGPADRVIAYDAGSGLYIRRWSSPYHEIASFAQDLLEDGRIDGSTSYQRERAAHRLSGGLRGRF